MHETVILLKTWIRSLGAIIAIATLGNAFLHEWIYTIPYISFEILNINIIVIIGWSVFVLLPLLLEKKLRNNPT